MENLENPSIEEIKRFLSLVGFLEPLSEHDLGEIARGAEYVRLDEDEALVVGAEEHGERMLLLLDGQAQIYETDPSGRELTLAVLEYGVPVGATGLVSRRMREMRVRALEPSLFCRVQSRDLDDVLSDNPEAALRFARLLGERLVWMESRWADLAAKEVVARLASMLLLLFEGEGVVTPEGYRIPTRYTHRQLSTMIGANREATTRALGRLREEGGVELKNRYIYVTDLEALRHASG